MPFVNVEHLPTLELFPKALSGIVEGEKMMLSFLVLETGCEIPEHSHPHEQAGLVLEGHLRFRIGSDERDVGPGEAFLIPANVVHAGYVDVGPVRVLDILAPPRQDYVDRYNDHTGTDQETRWR